MKIKHEIIAKLIGSLFLYFISSNSIACFMMFSASFSSSSSSSVNSAPLTSSPTNSVFVARLVTVPLLIASCCFLLFLKGSLFLLDINCSKLSESAACRTSIISCFSSLFLASLSLSYYFQFDVLIL